MNDEPTGFLYPFIESEERDGRSLLDDLARSASQKMAESRTLGDATVAGTAVELDRLSSLMEARFRAGGRLLCFGNGGSATDALSMARLYRTPPFGRPLAALALVEDQAVLTALANDVGFDLIFSRQLIALGRDSDMAVGFSTSGGSVNVLNAFAEASRRGMLTVGFAGYDGGAMATSVHLEHCLIVQSQSVHRIQEVQSRLAYRLWSLVQDRMAACVPVDRPEPFARKEAS
jgi:D-sedoheptulose 7-phosphate isomerase